MPEKINALTPIEKYMTEEVPLFSISQDFDSVKTFLLNQPTLFRKLNYVYFHDASSKLVGFTSFQKLISSKPGTTLSSFIRNDIVKCRIDATIEKAVSLAIHNNITDLPVTDKFGKLKGVITSDALLTMVGQLYSHKTYKHGGIVHDKSIYELVLKGSIFSLVKARIPWLLVGLIGVLAAANIVGNFENVLEANLILALFIPAVTYMSDAVGTQTETLFIRTLAIKEGDLDIYKYIIKDLLTTFVLGSVIGTILGTAVYIWKGSFAAALIIGLTMVINISVSSLIATATPTVFRHFGKDPAIVSGPLSTIIQDIVSLMVYFITAFVVLNALG